MRGAGKLLNGYVGECAMGASTKVHDCLLASHYNCVVALQGGWMEVRQVCNSCFEVS